MLHAFTKINPAYAGAGITAPTFMTCGLLWQVASLSRHKYVTCV